MELVTAAGEIVRATKEDPDPALREVSGFDSVNDDVEAGFHSIPRLLIPYKMARPRQVFEASTIHLGALGIVTELELEVVEAFSVFKVSTQACSVHQAPSIRWTDVYNSHKIHAADALPVPGGGAGAAAAHRAGL